MSNTEILQLYVSVLFIFEQYALYDLFFFFSSSYLFFLLHNK